MPTSERVQSAQDTLYYISPVIVLLYYSVSTLASICALHVPTKSKRQTSRNITDGLTFLILITYVYDSVALLFDSFSPHPQVASVASNVSLPFIWLLIQDIQILLTVLYKGAFNIVSVSLVHPIRVVSEGQGCCLVSVLWLMAPYNCLRNRTLGTIHQPPC